MYNCIVLYCNVMYSCIVMHIRVSIRENSDSLLRWPLHNAPSQALTNQPEVFFNPFESVALPPSPRPREIQRKTFCAEAINKPPTATPAQSLCDSGVINRAAKPQVYKIKQINLM